MDGLNNVCNIFLVRNIYCSIDDKDKEPPSLNAANNNCSLYDTSVLQVVKLKYILKYSYVYIL